MGKLDDIRALGMPGVARQYAVRAPKHAAGQKPRTGPPSNKAKLKAAIRSTKAKGLPVRQGKSNTEPVRQEPASLTPGFDKQAYQREYMRKRREAKAKP